MLFIKTKLESKNFKPEEIENGINQFRVRLTAKLQKSGSGSGTSAVEPFNEALITLERTGLTFGKSVERIRDEVDKIAFAFNMTQIQVMPVYKELHRLKGIKLTDFKEMISILELSRDAFGPDAAQLLAGVKFQQEMMKNGSAFQGIFMKIAQLKKKAMSGDESAVIQLKQEAMKLRSVARANLSLGETISGMSSDIIDDLLLFAESLLN